MRISLIQGEFVTQCKSMYQLFISYLAIT